jgi:hypothetical protein
VRKRLRDEAPLYRGNEQYGFHALSRYDDVDESRLERVHTATVRGYSSVPMRVR